MEARPRALMLVVVATLFALPLATAFALPIYEHELDVNDVTYFGQPCSWWHFPDKKTSPMVSATLTILASSVDPDDVVLVEFRDPEQVWHPVGHLVPHAPDHNLSTTVFDIPFEWIDYDSHMGVRATAEGWASTGISVSTLRIEHEDLEPPDIYLTVHQATVDVPTGEMFHAATVQVVDEYRPYPDVQIMISGDEDVTGDWEIIPTGEPRTYDIWLRAAVSKGKERVYNIHVYTRDAGENEATDDATVTVLRGNKGKGPNKPKPKK